MDECLYHKCKLWSQRILTPSKPSSCCYNLRVEGDWTCAEDTQNISRLDLKHNEHRRVRISQGYKAGDQLQPHYLIQLKYKKCDHDGTLQMCDP